MVASHCWRKSPCHLPHFPSGLSLNMSFVALSVLTAVVPASPLLSLSFSVVRLLLLAVLMNASPTETGMVVEEYSYHSRKLMSAV